MRSEALLLLLIGCAPSESGHVLSTPDTELPDPAVPPSDLGTMTEPSLTVDPPGAAFVDPMEVRLVATDPDAEIWYTDDGSVPVPGVSQQYTGPLTVSTSTQIRAVSTLFGTIPGEATAVFLELESSAAQHRSNLPQVVLWSHGTSPTFKTEVYEPYSLTAFEPPLGGEVAWPTSADLSVRAGIKIRGSSSAGYPKRPWRVETWTVTEDLVDRDVPLLGMPEDADWVLIAPLNFDRALMRNALVYHLSNAIGRYAPRTRFVELFVADQAEPIGSDDYEGIYLAVERIERNPDRVPLTELLPTEVSEPEITGGYLFKEDRPGPGEIGFWAGDVGGSFYFQQPFVMVEPSELLAPPEQQTWLADHLDHLGETLNAPDFRHPVTGEHYDQLIDVDSWIDHHIVNVLAKNPDALRLSGYFHKDREGVIHAGPVWDFDRTMGCDQDTRAADPTWWDNSNETTDTTYVFEHGLFEGLFRDPAFRDRYFARWSDLLANELSLPAILAVVADMEAELTVPAERNFAVWTDYPPRGGSLASEVDLLEAWITERHTWIQGCLALSDPRTCTGN